MVASSIDDLFRQKSLQEIHIILQQTRKDVENKKTELRELVGDHYRSVLESSDHIRAMSDCAAKVSDGSNRIEELIASMRELASNPPIPGSDIIEEPSKEDEEYDLCFRVMELLEIPDAVRGMVGDHHFAHAAWVAVVEASALQKEVDRLLDNAEASSASLQGFDLRGLVRQQDAAYRNLPRQVAAGCLDAFGSATLTPSGAAEAFLAHLLLDDASSPGQLLRRFVQRRSELLADILEGPATAFGGADQEGFTSRLIASAMAFEGTIILASGLSSSGAGGSLPPLLAVGMKCLNSQGTTGRSLKQNDDIGPSQALLREKVERITAMLTQQSSGPVSSAELSKLGVDFMKVWAPEEGMDGTRSLAARFSLLVTCSASGGPHTCKQLGDLQRHFGDRLKSYRRSLAEGAGLGAAPEDWSAVWSAACGLFSPGLVPRDALVTLTTTVERAGAEILRARIRELQLALEDETSLGESRDADESKRLEEISELRRQCRARVQHFDEELGGILEDVSSLSCNGEVPVSLTFALLEALQVWLEEVCQKVKLPSVQPAWPRDKNDAGSRSSSSWASQRSAARSALALEALYAATIDQADASSLGKMMQAAFSSGNTDLASVAEKINVSLKKRNEEAYCAWARLAVPDEGFAPLSAFWRLADDEVSTACGWGSAKFARQGEPGTSPTTEQDRTPTAKAVPVPIQASPFVFERLVFAAKKSLELTGDDSGPAATLTAAALKAALSECFVASYEAERPSDLVRLKRSGMSHLLQWLFDLNFLRVTLSAGAGPGGAAYEELRNLLGQAESAAFSDPVDRLLYQDVLKSAVTSHVQGTKVLLAPFFIHNPLYEFLSQGPSGNLGPSASSDDGFELQSTFAPPLRPVLPRFPLLPIAMNVAGAGSGPDLDRLRFDPERARAGKAGPHGDTGAGAAVSQLMQQAGGLVGSGLGSLGISSGLLGSNWGYPASGQQSRPPEAL
mmetsp:Transcript_16580/g.29014  ORF Transcript_16580/g.29014 Transcript_16580/m.29014 type:complete len:965 (-) Transcript_16580:47-2941(-)